MSEDEVLHLIEAWTPVCVEYIVSGKKQKRKQIGRAVRNKLEIDIGNPCPTCKQTLTASMQPGNNVNSSLTAEHIVPRSMGGDNKEENIIAMCQQCNFSRNQAMQKLMPYLSEQNRPKFTVGMKNDLARFLEWSIRTVFSPNSRLVDDQIQNLFEKAYNQLTLYGPHASKKFASVARAPTSDADVQLQILKVLEEIRDNQRLLLEQTRPRRGLFAWFGTGLRRLLPKRQPKPKPVEIKAQPTKPKKERRQRRRRRTPSESKAVSEASTKVKVAEQSPTEPVATEVIPRFETREIDGPISPIRGFSTSNKPRMRSLKYPPEPSILVSLLKAIEKQRASGEGWADLNESCVDIPNLSRNRRDATISEIRSATGHVRTDEMPDWDKIPATVELVELLEVNSLTKMSTSPAFDYLDLPSTLGLVSVYFAQARSALDDSEE